MNQTISDASYGSLSCSLEDEVPAGKVLKGKGKALVFGIRGECWRVMEIIGLLISRTNDHNPVTLEDSLQLHLDIL